MLSTFLVKQGNYRALEHSSDRLTCDLADLQASPDFKRGLHIRSGTRRDVCTRQLAGLALLHLNAARPAVAGQSSPTSPSESLVRTIARDFQQNQCEK